MEISNTIDKCDSSFKVIQNDTIKKSNSVESISIESNDLNGSEPNNESKDSAIEEECNNSNKISCDDIDDTEANLKNVFQPENRNSEIPVDVPAEVSLCSSDIATETDNIKEDDIESCESAADMDEIRELPIINAISLDEAGDGVRDPSSPRPDLMVTSCSLNNISGRKLLKKNCVVPAIKGTRGYGCPYRVTFPESLVANYLEPCNPWSRGSNGDIKNKSIIIKINKCYYLVYILVII